MGSFAKLSEVASFRAALSAFFAASDQVLEQLVGSESLSPQEVVGELGQDGGDIVSVATVLSRIVFEEGVEALVADAERSCTPQEVDRIREFLEKTGSGSFSRETARRERAQVAVFPTLVRAEMSTELRLVALEGEPLGKLVALSTLRIELDEAGVGGAKNLAFQLRNEELLLLRDEVARALGERQELARMAGTLDPDGQLFVRDAVVPGEDEGEGDAVVPN